MVNRLEQFKEDVLDIYNLSNVMRMTLIMDSLDVMFYARHLLTDKEFMGRQKEYGDILNKEYENLMFILNALNNLDEFNGELVDLYDIFNTIRENINFEAQLALNFSEYIFLNSFNTGRFWSIEEHRGGLTGNLNDYNFYCNQINLNNDSIEKVKRKEM